MKININEIEYEQCNGIAKLDKNKLKKEQNIN